MKQMVFRPAFEQFLEQIIESNSTDVEIVSGATFTSEVIINVFNNALAEESSERSERIALKDFPDGTILEYQRETMVL